MSNSERPLLKDIQWSYYHHMTRIKPSVKRLCDVRPRVNDGSKYGGYAWCGEKAEWVRADQAMCGFHAGQCAASYKASDVVTARSMMPSGICVTGFWGDRVPEADPKTGRYHGAVEYFASAALRMIFLRPKVRVVT